MPEWKEITTIEEWSKEMEQSVHTPILVLKHSTRCPISTAAWEECVKYTQKKITDHVRYILVKVIESRPVSNLIAEDLNVEHASPQLILLKDKQAVWNTSHWSITQENIEKQLKQI